MSDTDNGEHLRLAELETTRSEKMELLSSPNPRIWSVNMVRRLEEKNGALS